MVSINKTVKERDDEPSHTALYFSYQCLEGAKPRVDGQHLKITRIQRTVYLGCDRDGMYKVGKVADIVPQQICASTW